MTVLTEILSDIKVQGSVYFCDRLSPPWEMPFTDKDHASFHHVRRGHCWLEIDGEEQPLSPGDLLFIGRGDDHVLRSHSRTGPQAPQSPTLLLCGYFRFHEDLPAALMNGIPKFSILRDEELADRGWLKKTIDHLGAEYQGQHPGSEAVVNKLTEVLLVELLRYQVEQTKTNNIVAALYDSKLSRVLKLLHERPERPWTLEVLAAEVATSRSSLASRFKALVGQPMFQYLTELRIRRACELLRNTDLPLVQVSERVGYSSDLAFSKTFKNVKGITPTRYRKNARE